MRHLIIAAAFVLLVACGARAVKKDQEVTPTPETIAEAQDASDLGKMPKGTQPYQERTSGGLLRARGFICDEKPLGQWVYAYDNGQKRCQGIYLYGGVETSHWAYWWPNGRTRAEGDYQQGLEHGHWKYWHENGHPAAEGDWFRGKQAGNWKSWHDDGTDESGGAFVAGLRIGTWSFGDDGGVVTHSPAAR